MSKTIELSCYDAKRYVKTQDYLFVRKLCKNDKLINPVRYNDRDFCYYINVGNNTLIVDEVNCVLEYQS